MDSSRLRAPSTDGALLAEPPPAGAGDLLAANHDRLARWDHNFQGRSSTWLRPQIRAQVLDLARRYLAEHGLEPFSEPGPGTSPGLVVTGHQPELFHPGVWVKNFATGLIARQNGAVGLNLIVDNDTPKSSSVKVPRFEGGAARVERVPFDDWRGEIPYEDLAVTDEDLFASFRSRAIEALGGAVDDPVLDEFWPLAVAARGRTSNLGLRFATARRGVESSGGVRNAELPLSVVCETEGFLWFVSHLLAQLPRFQEIHNEALRQYRALHHIRSRHHPVPALAEQGEWREAPFWVWRASAPRRRPLFARQLSRTMELRIGGEDETLLELPLTPDREACCAVERLMSLPSQGVRLRTRALTTTMFARYLLGDLFLHGIGGAKYDELGDAVSGRFFGIEPPAYMTLSMTLWLGLRDDPSAPGRLADADWELRDLTYNPDRHLPPSDDPEPRHWVEAKRQAVSAPAVTDLQKRQRFQAIRRCNEALQAWVENRRREVEAQREVLRALVRRNAVARSREYASVLHSRRRLRAILGHALPGLRLQGG